MRCAGIEQILPPGYDQLQMYTACHRLSELPVDSDPEAARSYAAMADSLDFAPAVEALGINLALSNLEFPRRERELLLNAGKQRTRLLVTNLILSVIIAGMLVVFLLAAQRALQHEETRNADLIKANLQLLQGHQSIGNDKKTNQRLL